MPCPGRSTAAARRPREERERRAWRKEKDPAARPGRTRTAGRCAAAVVVGLEVTAKRSGPGWSLRTLPPEAWERRREGRGGGGEEEGRRWGRRSARRETAAVR
ncbi:Os11g0544150 [Oryza sativa Japonica Group]|uniref:Os11g0544150 protein n=1 Tax=Oryza sativa subsp. japonica TaxID=39947 RepID=A0A0P0Y384_ORYSJ|nr:hypothetical protein EE612_056009 [Oryza sativa]BAT14355.1 Os11g0544150 [Oryza sativa Japonica Group]